MKQPPSSGRRSLSRPSKQPETKTTTGGGVGSGLTQQRSHKVLTPKRNLLGRKVSGAISSGGGAVP